MLDNILKKIFGTKNDRELKRLSLLLREINNLEPAMTALNDEELKAKTPYFREKLKNGFSLDDILTEAFATAREASRRTLGCGRLMCRLSEASLYTKAKLRK
jgi:preprotein translocase subunit SecA